MAGTGATDEDLLVLLSGIELAAAAVHDAVVNAGLLDATAAALVTSFAEHHRAHAAAYGELHPDGAATEADPTAIEVLFTPVFGAVDAATLLQGALDVEDVMVATAIDACARFDDHDVAELAARVAAVEARHQAILLAATGAPAAPAVDTGASLLDA